MVSGAALLWRLSNEMDERPRHRAEYISLQIAGACLLILGGYILIEAATNLWSGRSSATSWLGILITSAALILMPILAQAKRRVGRALDSEAMMTDAKQTDFCMYQAAIVLLGLVLDGPIAPLRCCSFRFWCARASSRYEEGHAARTTPPPLKPK
jgi:Cation efflux family